RVPDPFRADRGGFGFDGGDEVPAEAASGAFAKGVPTALSQTARLDPIALAVNHRRPGVQRQGGSLVIGPLLNEPSQRLLVARRFLLAKRRVVSPGQTRQIDVEKRRRIGVLAVEQQQV